MPLEIFSEGAIFNLPEGTCFFSAKIPAGTISFSDRLISPAT
jgi:hypothetical protein